MRASVLLTACLAGWQFLAVSIQAAPPKLTYLFPAGAQRGQTAEITATGEFSKWPVQFAADRKGLTVTAEKDKGKLKVAVDADAVPGVYWLRAANEEGASTLRPFIVGTLPEVSESEPNDAPTKPQTVEPRIVINGRLGKSGDVDGFGLVLKEGQTLVASVRADSILGSPMDSVLQVCELVQRPTASSGISPPAEAFVVEQNHDSAGLDPQIVMTVPRDGTYLVRLFAFPSMPNSSIAFAGGDTFIYRLTITTGGFLDHALPLAVTAGEATEAELFGWNIPEAASALSIAPHGDASESLGPPPDAPLTAFHPEVAGSIELSPAEGANVIAADASDLKTPQAITLPATVSGRLESERDVDAFSFKAAKGDKVRIAANSRGLGFPLDPVLSIVDASGATLTEADDMGRTDRDPELLFTAPADGEYKAVIRDLHGRGGLRFVYRLTIGPATPDFSLTMAADSFVLTAGKPLEIPVTIARRNGFKKPIELRVVGLPAGVTAEPLVSDGTKEAPTAAKADDSKGKRGRRGGGTPPAAPSVKLVLKSDAATAPAGGFAIRIEGSTVGENAEDKPVVRSARFPTNLPMTNPQPALWLTVQK